MVFVHARQETRRTAYALREAAQANGTLSCFLPSGDDARLMNAKKLMQRSRNGQLKVRRAISALGDCWRDLG